jgi:hypothetical protein
MRAGFPKKFIASDRRGEIFTRLSDAEAGGAGGIGFPSFNLPLNDLGNGIVNTAPSIALGSATPTFTRATTGYTKLATGLWAPVGIGVARSGYLGFNDTPSAYGGWFAEGARTNLLLFSNDLTNAAWVKTTMSTAATSTGPDGVANSATRVTATAGNALCMQLITAAASSRTLSFWVKRITGAGNFDLTQDGLAFTTVATTAGWTQVPGLTASILNATPGFRIVTNGDAFDVWCGQFEAGTFASSPIPTAAVAVTRNMDILTYPGAGNVLAAQGTLYCESFPNTLTILGGGYGAMSVNDGSSNNRVDIRILGVSPNNSNITSSAGVAQSNISAGIPVVGAIQKTGASWTLNKVDFVSNTTAGTEDIVATPPAALTIIHIGTLDGAVNSLFGFVYNVRIYPTALSAAQLQVLTA